jgi:hypothetical protein
LPGASATPLELFALSYHRIFSRAVIASRAWLLMPVGD